MYLTNTLQVDEARRQIVIETPGDGCYGIYKAPTADGDWNVYMETNGDPVTFPHHSDADCDCLMAAILSDAGITMGDFEAALGCPWSDWCN